MDGLTQSHLQVDGRPKLPMGGRSKHKANYVWTGDQSRQQVDEQLKSPMGERSKHKVAYRWMDDQSHLQVDYLNIKSPKGVHDRWPDNQSPSKATRDVTRTIKTTIDGLQRLEKSEIYINHLKT